MFQLTNKKALITGATGGIGGAIVQAYLDAGARVAGSGSNQEKLDAAAAALGSGFTGLQANLSEADAPAALVSQAEQFLEGLDILVCNAGVTRDGLAMRMKDEQWQEVIDINLTANFKLARAAFKTMMKQRSGRIIFITSVVAHSGNPGQANYCASKAGLLGMAKSMAKEAASRGITINCIAPGFIATSMTDALTDDQKAAISQNIPAGRMGSPEDIAAAALYLASDQASYVTGETMHVNGGLWMA